MKEKVDQEELLRIFPGKLRKRIEEKVSFEEVTEIRLRTGLPISIVTAEESYFLQKQEGCGEREKEEEKQEDRQKCWSDGAVLYAGSPRSHCQPGTV